MQNEICIISGTCSVSPRHLDITAHYKNGLSRLTFSLRESVGMYRGSALPLDFVIRILSSKFWMMESDVWADLLIICRWANPTTTTIQTEDVTCTLCDEVWIDPATTACGHTFCRKCLTISISQCKDCPAAECGAELKGVISVNRAAEKLLERYRQERQVKPEELQHACKEARINFEPPPDSHECKSDQLGGTESFLFDNGLINLFIHCICRFKKKEACRKW